MTRLAAFVADLPWALMPSRNDPRHSEGVRASRSGVRGGVSDGTPARWLAQRSLTVAVLAAFACLGGWIVVGAITASEPSGFIVVPPEHAAPAMSAHGEWADSVQEPAEEPSTEQRPAVGGVTTGNSARVDPGWAARSSAATGIPLRALQGYAGAELAMAAEAPECGIRWSTLAALGSIESAHGTHAGSSIGDDGLTLPSIFGIDLTGESSARITDTDDGVWDGKADIDRAVGPMQFIPATWETWGVDGNGDGVRDPQHIDDAALAAAGYLCHYGDLSSPDNWRSAIFAYNHLDSYVIAVARAANDYAGRAG